MADMSINMQKIVLYCKTYHRDLDRTKYLAQSVSKYNIDNIPFYISVPLSDVELFKQNINNAIIISDEEVNKNNDLYNRGINPRVLAFSTRLNIWMLGVSENYFCLDSDAYFIRPFGVKDFIYDENTPYTVMHEQKELFSWTAVNHRMLGFDPSESFRSERDKIMSIFGRKGRHYDFGPNPMIMNSNVLKMLNEQYLTPNKISTEHLISISSDEYTWYGEALLAFDVVKIRPTEPYFKVFHYPQQYAEYRQKGITEENISKNYMGIILQSNWSNSTKY